MIAGPSGLPCRRRSLSDQVGFLANKPGTDEFRKKGRIAPELQRARYGTQPNLTPHPRGILAA